MKLQILCLVVWFVPASGSAQESRTLIAETNHSTILFSVPISEGITRITGKFNDYSIEVDLIEGDEVKISRISAIIKVGSIDTGIPSRDEDLKTGSFFEIDKYPEITFVSQHIEKAGDSYVAHGQFQMHGITQDMSLPFKITGKKSENVIGFSCRHTIKRSDFGVGTTWKHTTDDKFIADEIGVEIDFWTRRPRK